MKRNIAGETAFSLVLAMILVGLLGLTMALVQAVDQAKRPERPAAGLDHPVPAVTTVPEALCLVEGVVQPETCRGTLPECLAEDGSGPGVRCWFTGEEGIWFNDGDETNDHQKLP